MFGKFLSSLADRGKGALLGAVQRSLASVSAPGVRVGRISVNVLPAKTGYHIHTRQFILGPTGPTDRPLVLDLTGCALPIVSMRCGSAMLPPDGLSGFSESAVSLNPRPGVSWNAAELDCIFEWHPGSSSEDHPFCAVFPDFLPRIMSNPGLLGSTPYLQPRIQVRVPEELQVGGIPAGDEVGSRFDNDLLQAVLVQGNRLGTPDSSEERVLLAPDYISNVEPVYHQRVANLTLRIRDFIARTIGHGESTRLVVTSHKVLTSTANQPMGAYLAVVPQFFGVGKFGSDIADPADVALGGRIASAWWGYGCQLAGSHARELELGICAAIGLRWAMHIGEEGLTHTMLNQLRNDAASPGGALRRSDNVIPTSHRNLAFVALSCYEAMRQDPGRVDAALRQFMEEHWGCVVHQDRALAALGSAGVRLPNLFLA